MNLRQTRKANNLTQQALADLTGLTQATINNLEIGRHKAWQITREKIQAVLGKVDFE